MCPRVQLPKETRDIASPRAAFAGGCESLGMSAGSPTQVLWKNSACLQSKEQPLKKKKRRIGLSVVCKRLIN